MRKTICESCGNEALKSPKNYPTCINCAGNTCIECGQCDCECECQEFNNAN